MNVSIEFEIEILPKTTKNKDNSQVPINRTTIEVPIPRRMLLPDERLEISIQNVMAHELKVIVPPSIHAERVCDKFLTSIQDAAGFAYDANLPLFSYDYHHQLLHVMI